MVRLLFHVAFTLLLSQRVTALYFLIDGTSEKCFYEDLPKDTIVVGKYWKYVLHGVRITCLLTDNFV